MRMPDLIYFIRLTNLLNLQKYPKLNFLSKLGILWSQGDFSKWPRLFAWLEDAVFANSTSLLVIISWYRLICRIYDLVIKINSNKMSIFVGNVLLL